MIEPKVGFIVYGVHKDGLADPMGQPFIDGAVVERSKDALLKAGLKLVTHDTVIASKEAQWPRAALRRGRCPPSGLASSLQRRAAAAACVATSAPSGRR